VKSPVFNDKPQGSRLRGRPNNMSCVQPDINERKFKNWKRRSKNRADLKSIREAKVGIEL
jgi:hypothetical protein